MTRTLQSSAPGCLRPVVRRAGVSLIEILVATTIVGLLAALLTPAVVSVRESARRTTCTNRLHQIGIAAQNYESVWRVFPGTDRWFRQLLRHMEQPDDATVVTAYACPSDRYGKGDLSRWQISYRVNQGGRVGRPDQAPRVHTFRPQMRSACGGQNRATGAGPFVKRQVPPQTQFAVLRPFRSPPAIS